MFAVIYRAFIYPAHEKDYQDAWRVIANYFLHTRGALGSCLHKTQQGEWIAYSRWPSQAMRDAAWLTQEDLSAEIKLTIQILKSCIDHTKPYEEICMQVTDDLL